MYELPVENTELQLDSPEKSKRKSRLGSKIMGWFARDADAGYFAAREIPLASPEPYADSRAAWDGGRWVNPEIYTHNLSGRAAAMITRAQMMVPPGS